MRNLNSMGNQIKVSLPTDKNGLISRECPECKGVFKIKLGTGLKGKNLPCHCPYCGWTNDMSEFNTSEQIEYAKSVAINEIMGALQQDIKEWGRELERSTRNSFIKMKVDFNSSPHQIQYYQEKQLETYITCEVCTLEYAIYGVFAFCPDCGTHNSIQILNKNMELVQKEITFANTLDDKELSLHLIEDALENAVSAFDGFGRATSLAFAGKSSDENQAKDISFQNIFAARKRIKTLFGIDFASSINETEWEAIIRCFQKRHLLAHKMGVIDEEYIEKAKDINAILGRKIAVSQDEVIELLRLLKIIGKDLYEKLNS
jgi:hypothetical protein